MHLLLSSHLCNTSAFYPLPDPTLWPSGFFYTVQKFLLSDILRCIGIARKKKVFLSVCLFVSLYCLLCGRYKVRIFIIRLNSLKHSQ